MFGSMLKHRAYKMVMLIVAGLVAGGMSLTANAAADNAKVKAAMAALKADATKLGAPKVEGDSLYFGSTKINDNFDLVDALKAKHGGTATFFVRKDNAFVRVSTNVMKEGKRAVGTQLDPNGPAIAAIRQGNPFYGVVDILGKLYDTGYEPIKNDKGEVVGIYYVGYLME